MFDDVQTNGTGHLTITNLKTVTLPDSTFTSTAKGLVPVGGTGTTKFLRQYGTFQIPSYATYSWQLETDSGAGAKVTVAEDDIVVLTSGNSTLDVTNSGLSASINMPNTGTSGTYTSVTTDAQGRVTAGTNPGGDNGGMFTDTVAFAAATAKTLFRLTRTTTGQLIFDVYLTSATSGYSCKKYTVAHRINTNPTYNKIIDSGAIANGDYVVAFTNDGQGVGGDTVKCQITATTAQNISYTIQVGEGSTGVTRYTS